MKQQNLIVELKQRNSQEHVGSTADADELLKELEAKQQQLADLQSQLTTKGTEITKLEKDISELQNKVLNKVDKSIYDSLQAKYDRDINIPRDLEAFKTEVNSTITNTLATNTAKIQELQETIERNSLVVELNKQLVAAQGQITQLNLQNTSLHNENAQVKMQNQNLQTRINVLEQELAQSQDQNSQINRGWLVQRYGSTSIDEFYEMYKNSSAMRELGIMLSSKEYGHIISQFLNKLPLLKAASYNDIYKCYSAIGNVINLKDKIYTQGIATNAKYSVFGSYYNEENENNAAAVYVNYENYNKLDTFPVYKKFIQDNGWDKLEFRYELVSYNKKFIFLSNIIGNFGNRNAKVKLRIKFELSDGSFTNPQEILVTQPGEYIDMGVSTRPNSVRYIHSDLCYWWGVLPDNAVAVRYLLDYSEMFNANLYLDNNSFIFSSPEIRGI